MTYRNALLRTLLGAGLLAATACASMDAVVSDPDYLSTGAIVETSTTAYSGQLACMKRTTAAEKPRIAVGDIRDMTGRFSTFEGAVATQGASLMVMTALSQAGFPLAERLDTAVAEQELEFANNRLISEAGEPTEDYRKVFTGSIAGSDYILLGGDLVDADVNLGGDTLVDADVNLGLDTPVAGDASNAASNAVDYATRQVNSGNQTATLNLVSGAMGEITGTAAAIGNSYSIDSVADAVSSVNQANSGAGYANANVDIQNSGIATATTAAIGNTASVTSDVSTIATRSSQSNSGYMTTQMNASINDITEATATAASIGNSLSVEIPGSGSMSAQQYNSGTMVAELNGRLSGFADGTATAAAIGNSASLTSLNSDVVGNVMTRINQANSGHQISTLAAQVSHGAEAAATAASIGNTVNISVQ